MPTDPKLAPFPAPRRPAALSSEANRPSRRALTLAAGVAGGIALVIVVVGVAGRMLHASRTAAWTDTQSVPAVSVVSPSYESDSQGLVLPGSLQAYYNAPIYSRVSGYVRAWNQDIGARVKTGQLLATIDTPELDQQIIQARANLVSAEAERDLAATTAQRWTRLLSQDAVSKQETDEKTGDLAVKTARVNAVKADLGRLQAFKAFARIVAPFDGVVTARKTDIGALVNAGSSASTTTELFDVAKVDQLRLYVSVPQNQSARLKAGVPATLSVPEYPGRSFPATVITTANAVSDRTGTLLVELLVNNTTGALKAGDYAEVRFQTADVNPQTLVLPSSALLFRKTGMVAAVVGEDDHVHLRPVTVGRDLGAVIEVDTGVRPEDRVINNPPDSLADGQLVRVVRPDTAPARRPAPGQAD
jgi:RND family efflux transporter MFP subunit